MHPDIPQHLSSRRQDTLQELIHELDAALGDLLLGAMLTGSAARGLETAHSDLDVIFVLERAMPNTTLFDSRPGVELIPITLAHLETAATYGSPDWGYRWSYAWAPILLDRTGGRITQAVDRQTHLTCQEADDILVVQQRLDTWINYLYRALKSAKYGRPLEARLDGAESIGVFLEVLFALHGLVRPYNSYLRWALRHYPLPGWNDDDLFELMGRMSRGDPDALRRVYARVWDECVAFDRARRQERLQAVIAGWDGASYDVLRG
jgi:hypothetical protein